MPRARVGNKTKPVDQFIKPNNEIPDPKKCTSKDFKKRYNTVKSLNTM